MNRSFGRFDPFVSDIAAGSLNCLIHCVAGQNAERNRDFVVQAQSSKSIANRRVDVLVMGCFATNHTPQCQHGVITFCFKCPLNRSRNFPRPRNPKNSDLAGWHKVSGKRLDRTFQQLACDTCVIFGYHHGEPVSCNRTRGTVKLLNQNRPQPLRKDKQGPILPDSG